MSRDSVDTGNMQGEGRRRALAAGVALGALIGAVAVPAQAAAQPAAGQPAATAAAQPSDVEEVLVTARRRTERLLDVPVAATSVGAEQIRQYNVTNLANIKVAAPQISFDRGGTGSGASISLRGVSSSSLDAGLEQSVLVDFDGMPVSRGRVVSDALFDVAGIDVLKGPQALFFGKNSPGGVVSIRTENPTPTFGGYLRAGYEFTKKEKSVEGAVNVPLTDQLGVRLAVFGSKSEGYLKNQDRAGVTDPFRTARLPTFTGGTFDPPGKKLYGAEKKIAGRLTVRYDDGSLDATFKLLGSHFASDGIQMLAEVMACPAGQGRPVTVNVPDPTGDCRLDNKVSYGLPPAAVLASWPEVARYNGGKPYTRNDLIMPTLTVNKRVGDVTLTSITSLMHYDFVNQGNSDKTSYSYFFSNNNERDTQFMQELRVVTAFDGPFNITAGGYYAQDIRTFFNGTANIAPVDPATGKLNTFDLRADNKSHAFSGFAQLIWKPVERVELAGGARYTRETKKIAMRNTFVNAAVVANFLPVSRVIAGERTEDNVSPEVTLSFHPTENVMTYVAYKTGYLSGGFSNPGNLTPRITLENDTYDAEKARGFEGGVKFQLLERRLSGSLVGYRYVYKGLQLTSIDLSANPPLVRTQNAADSISRGVEFEAGYRIAPGVSLRGSANYNDAHFREFTGAQCYTLQTAALGCVAGLQDLSGKPINRAPKWIVTGGAVYDVEMAGGYRLSLNANVRYTSSYYVSVNLNPLALQRSYTLLDAGARFSLPGDRWSVALIGRNLTNRHYGTIGNDKTSGNGEVSATGGEPRAVVVQIETRF
jgi:iron complex outermembrane recepter protein